MAISANSANLSSNNSSLFLIPQKVRAIGSQLYCKSYNQLNCITIAMIFSLLILLLKFVNREVSNNRKKVQKSHHIWARYLQLPRNEIVLMQGWCQKTPPPSVCPLRVKIYVTPSWALLFKDQLVLILVYLLIKPIDLIQD